MTDPPLRFPFTRPEVPRPETWLGYLETAYEQRRFANNGPLVQRLERELVRGVSEREAVTAASGTAGLVGALLGLGVRGPVALPSFTFPATAHALELAGCTPVFCDIDPETLELSPEAAGEVVREHGCVAIMHVRSFGLCRELTEMEETAAAAGVPLVVDAAAAYGGETAPAEPVGGAGDAEVFSFHATKVFAAGEGGAVFAPPGVASRIRQAMNFSMSGADIEGPGLNGKMSELTAAVCLAMLEQLHDNIARRVDAVEQLMAACRESGAKVQAPASPGRPPWQALPVLLADEAGRDSALAQLRGAGIEARPYYAPLHRTRAFAGCAAGPLSATEEVAGRVLCLPVYSDFTIKELDDLCSALRDALTSTPLEVDHGVAGR
jgi:dTDP-4-amino-4,6-dideoxygalactose transaminase